MSERPDRLRAERETVTRSAGGEKVASRPPQVDEDKGGTRISRSDDVEGLTSQAGPSHIVDPSKYQHQHEVHQH